MNWVGIVGGISGFVWALRWIPIPAPQSVGLVLLMLNIVLGMVWLVGVSRIVMGSDTA
jgi:xanthosine utilization system XapX-like protein